MIVWPLPMKIGARAASADGLPQETQASSSFAARHLSFADHYGRRANAEGDAEGVHQKVAQPGVSTGNNELEKLDARGKCS